MELLKHRTTSQTNTPPCQSSTWGLLSLVLFKDCGSLDRREQVHVFLKFQNLYCKQNKTKQKNTCGIDCVVKLQNKESRNRHEHGVLYRVIFLLCRASRLPDSMLGLINYLSYSERSRFSPGFITSSWRKCGVRKNEMHRER